MSLLAVASVRSSPGATTLATGLAFAEASLVDEVLLVEGDASGGVLALRFGLNASPNLRTFAADVRVTFSTEGLWNNTQNMRGVRCIVSPPGSGQAEAWRAKCTSTLAENAASLGVPIIADLGQISRSNGSLDMVNSAETTVLVTRPELAEVQSLVRAVQTVQEAGGNPVLVCVGDTPYDPKEVAHAAQVPLVGIVPDQPAMARALCGYDFKPRKFHRSLFWRSILDIHNRVMPAPATVPLMADVSAAAPVPGVEVPVVAGAPVVSDAPMVADAPAVQYDRHTLTGPMGSIEISTSSPTTLGRSPTCDLSLDDTHMSRFHAEIQPGDQGLVLLDNGSTNGVHVNGCATTRHHLRPGDQVRVGRTTLTFDSYMPPTGNPTNHPSANPNEGRAA